MVEILEKTRSLPNLPGVYKMLNTEGEILYIGKAKNLKKRVSSYFQRSQNHNLKTQRLVVQIVDVDFTVVDSELEAIVLEANLIKEFRPKYNILLKDDKNFVYIKVTTNEAFPRVSVVRKVLKDGAKYFGPKTSAAQALVTLKALKKIFPYRHCSLDIEFDENAAFDANDSLTWRNRVQLRNVNIPVPCLDYHIKRCSGPCIGTQSPEEYALIIRDLVDFLSGKTESVVSNLQNAMRDAAFDKKFELAARIRDRLVMVEAMSEKQKVSDPTLEDLDVLHKVLWRDRAYISVLTIRGGKMVNQETFVMSLPQEFLDEGNLELEKEILPKFLLQYFDSNSDLPAQILLPDEISDCELLTHALEKISGRRTKLVFPQRGKKNQLLLLALKNAQSHCLRDRKAWEEKFQGGDALVQLKEVLNLNSKPRRIECYDISHFAGDNTVCSMVVFENGRPAKDLYRQFQIKTLQKGEVDDYKSLKETVSRRLKYLQGDLGEVFLSRGVFKEVIDEESKFKFSKAVWKVLKNDKKTLLASLQLLKIFDEKERILLQLGADFFALDDWRDLFFQILRKIKANRIYFSVSGAQEDQIAELGVVLVKKIPKSLQDFLKENEFLFVYEARKLTDISFGKKPQVILIDGGKGQLSAVNEVLASTAVAGICLISIAKREEEIFIVGDLEPLKLDKNSSAQKLLQSLRDEAHRFANEYRKKLGKKDFFA
jgi:excinuclease ABC subunit C